MTTQTRIDLFDKAVNEAYEWINEVDRETGLDDRHYAFAALRGTLHAIRDEITPDQSGHVSAQLPTLIRGVYFEGWDPSRTPADDRTVDGFLDHVRPSFMGYGREYNLLQIVRDTLAVLERKLPDVMAKVKHTLPRHVREVWP